MADYGMKELYDVVIKTPVAIEIDGVMFEPNETIAAFDKLQIANFNEMVNKTEVRGGFGNSPLITWQNTSYVDFTFTQGVFSKSQFAIMNNAALIYNVDTTVKVNSRIKVESDANCIIFVPNEAIDNEIWAYCADTGAKISFTKQDAHHYLIDEPYKDVLVDYNYFYVGDSSTMQIGKQFIHSDLELYGRTKVVDDITGNVTTGILHIPKLRLTSSLTMRLGQGAAPIIGRFSAQAIPVNGRWDPKVMELSFLDTDIDSDI